MKTQTCTVIIHTHNEEDNIIECITSAKLLTSNVILIDMESSDETLTRAKKNEAEVFSFPFSNYVEPAREFGIKKAITPWVFLLDADERITKELAEEINSLTTNYIGSTKLSAKSAQLLTTHYKVPRKNIFGNKKWLQHGGWWPDHQIRLINTKYFKSWPKEIHSTPQIDGKLGYLKNPIKHFFHGDLEQMVKKTIIFENIESELLFKANKNVSTPTFFRKYFGELYRRLFVKVGFLDGPFGIIESIYQAYSKTITYIFLYEKKNSRSL